MPSDQDPVQMLSREAQVAAIEAGGSVLVRFPDGRGVHATRVDQLPSEAEFARASNDPARVRATRQEIEARKKALDAEIAKLDAAERASEPPKSLAQPPATKGK